MILWSLLLLLPLARSVYGDVRHPHEGCNTSSNLYLDKVIKVRAQSGYTSMWDINEDVIELGLYDRRGVLNVLVAEDTTVELKYVDERILKVSVENWFGSYQHGWSRFVEIHYKAKRECSEDGVHHIHLELTNSLRNSSNEVVLKYRQICDRTKEKEEEQLRTLKDTSLRTKWIQDGHCPEPKPSTEKPNFRLVYRLIYNRGSRVRSIPADSDGVIIFVTQGRGKWAFNATSEHPEHLVVDSYTKSIDTDGLVFSFVKYYSKAPGDPIVDLYYDTSRDFRVTIPVVPGFTEFWNTTSFAGTNLTGEASLFTVWHFDPNKNVGVQFDGPDGDNVFRIQKEFKGDDEIVIVMKHEVEGEWRIDIWPDFIAWPVHMNYHTIDIPHRNLMNIGQETLNQSIGLELISSAKDKTTKYTLEINAQSKVPELSTQNPSPASSETPKSSSTEDADPPKSSSTQNLNTEPSGTPESSATEDPDYDSNSVTGPDATVALHLSELKTYSLGNNSALLKETENIVLADEEGVYHVYKEATNFAMVFEIEGEWKELNIVFENQRHQKVSRKLKGRLHTWTLFFQAGQGPYKLTLTNPETEEKREYPIQIHFKKSIVNVHPPDNF